MKSQEPMVMITIFIAKSLSLSYHFVSSLEVSYEH